MRHIAKTFSATAVLSFALIAGTALCVHLLSSVTARADAAKGQQLFARCKACHTTESQGASKVGPNLFGIVGHNAASVQAFKYSDAMKGFGKAWSADLLDQFLENPKKLIPGNKMVFAGLPKKADRTDLIDFLQSLK